MAHIQKYFKVGLSHRLLPGGFHEVLQQGAELRPEPRPPRLHRDNDQGRVARPALQLPPVTREAVRDVRHQVMLTSDWLKLSNTDC